jgi:hypothetical protein
MPLITVHVLYKHHVQPMSLYACLCADTVHVMYIHITCMLTSMYIFTYTCTWVHINLNTCNATHCPPNPRGTCTCTLYVRTLNFGFSLPSAQGDCLAFRCWETGIRCILLAPHPSYRIPGHNPAFRDTGSQVKITPRTKSPEATALKTPISWHRQMRHRKLCPSCGPVSQMYSKVASIVGGLELKKKSLSVAQQKHRQQKTCQLQHRNEGWRFTDGQSATWTAERTGPFDAQSPYHSHTGWVRAITHSLSVHLRES